MATNVDNAFTVENVLSVLGKATRDGNSFTALCPAHPDRNPSLRISLGQSGLAVVYCFACHDKDAAHRVILEKIRNRNASGLAQPYPKVELEAEEPADFDSASAGKSLEGWQEAREDIFSPAFSFVTELRGISDETATRLGYGYRSDNNALVIPTFWQGGLIGLKFRNISDNPGGYKWWQVRGSRQDILMGADLDPIDPTSRAVAVLEAPLDMALVHSLGFNAVTLISSTFQESERFLAGVEAVKQKYDHVLLIGDNDPAGREAMRRMRELIGTGASFHYLPAACKDIGDFYKANAEGAKRWLRNQFADALTCRPVPRGDTEEKLFDNLRRTIDEAAPQGSNGVTSLVQTLKKQLNAFQSLDVEEPGPLSPVTLTGLTGEFVDAALPFTEASAEGLVYQFLAAMGNCFGMKAYANFGTDQHYPGLFILIVGGTASGKGQSLSSVRSLMKLVDPEWESLHWRSSAASGEGLVRLASENAEDGRLFLTLAEMSTLLNSMKRDGSNLSGYLRLAYDRVPLENQKAKGGIVAKNYVLSAVGHITPEELGETLGSVDFYNGAVNRFLWAHVTKSKTLPRMSRTPDFSALAEKLRNLLDLPAVGAVEFTKNAGRTWDEWVYSLPEMEGKLDAACERSKPNAYRLALILALLDEERLRSQKPTEIHERHVKAAIELVTRSRESVAWFLNQPGNAGARGGYSEVQKLCAKVNELRGEITSSQLGQLFKHKSADQRTAIATAAGLKLRRKESGESGGRPLEAWGW